MSALFSAVVAARNALYDRGAFRQKRLARPVISIGNLSVGGAGKTPFTILLAELLALRGLQPDILSRGYGRKSAGVLVVDPKGDPSHFGDEPLLMARRLNVPVIVGESRYAAGLEAERRFGSDVHLLDDGFQHRQLARDFDIVLLSPGDLAERLLPRGRLREPLSSLRRADAVVWPDAAGQPSLPVAKPVWRVQRRIELPAECPRRPFVFCALAVPERFLEDLRGAGVQLVGSRCFRDHHAYTKRDLSELSRAAERAGADGFLTTEKDAVKLSSHGELPKLGIVRLSLELKDPEQALECIFEKLHGK